MIISEKDTCILNKNYISIGNRTAAISYYKNFETSLWNSLNITPNEEISSFYKSLYAGNQDNFLVS
ncbi:MAG: hypothetical protein RR636_02600 [Clostridium sp.]|uniref:hypothetical protein n=1 Tax=Clostridium sp. TaxID=1506 RepID=UPI0030568A24